MSTNGLLHLDVSALRLIAEYSGCRALHNLFLCGNRVLTYKMTSPSGISHYQNVDEYGNVIKWSDWVLNQLQGLKSLSLKTDAKYSGSPTLKNLASQLISLEFSGEHALSWWEEEGDLPGSSQLFDFARLSPGLTSLNLCAPYNFDVHIALSALPPCIERLSIPAPALSQGAILGCIPNFPVLHSLKLHGDSLAMLPANFGTMSTKLRRLELPHFDVLSSAGASIAISSFILHSPSLEALHIPHVWLLAQDLESCAQLQELSCASYAHFTSQGQWPAAITSKIRRLHFADLDPRWPSSFDGSPFPSLEFLEEVSGQYDVETWELPPSLTELRFDLFTASSDKANYHDYRLRRLPKHIKRLASRKPFFRDGGNDVESFLTILFRETSVEIMEFQDAIYFRAKNMSQSVPCRAAIAGFTGMTCLTHAVQVGALEDLHFALCLNKDPQWLPRQSRFHPNSLIWLSRHGFLKAN